MQLYVGNLDYGTTEDSLKDLFSPIGEVVSTKIIMDRETGRSKGFGFVEMAEKGDPCKFRLCRISRVNVNDQAAYRT